MEPYVQAYIPAVIFFLSIIGLMMYAGTHDPKHPRSRPHRDPH